MQFNFENNIEGAQQDLGFWGTAGDIAAAPFRGLAGAAEGVYDLADWVLQDWLPDAEDNFGLGHSQTMAGGLVEGMSQFLTGFVPGMGLVGWAGRGLGVASKMGKGGQILKAGSVTRAAQAATAAGKFKKAKAIEWGGQFGKASIAGGIADMTVFDAHEQRLSNLLQMYPSLQNPVSEFLAADPNDSEMEGRLKNFLEGGILGFAVEPFVMGLKSIKAARSAKSAGVDPEKAVSLVMGAERQRKVESIFPHLRAEEATAADAVARSMGFDVLDDSFRFDQGGDIGTTALRQMPDGTTKETRLLGTFTSKLNDVLRDMSQRKQSASQLRGALKKQGVKDDEVYWSGLDDYLKENPKVNLDEAMESIGNIRLEEVARGANTPKEVIHDQWTLPGGSDQTELLITWGGDPANFRARSTPVVHNLDATSGLYEDGMRYKIKTGTALDDLDTFVYGATKEEALEKWRAQDQVKFKESGHWSEANVLGWTRFNTRKGPKGEKVLFIEELQSDWHQRGRQSGYAGDIEETWGFRWHIEDTEARRAANNPAYITVDVDRKHAPWDTFLIPSYKTKANAEKALNKKFTLDSFTIRPQAFDGSIRINILGSDGMTRSLYFPAIPQSADGSSRIDIRGSDALRVSVMTDRAQLTKWFGEDAADDLIEGWRGWYTKRGLEDDVAVDFKNKKHELFVFPEDVRKAGVARRTTELGSNDGPPQAPFKKTWDSLLMKRMISHAVDNDFDAIAWTTGKQQSDRWGGQEGLAKFYDNILPKTANKIGKKFGARVTKEPLKRNESNVTLVEKVELKIEQTQPYMKLTAELKASVKERGQRLFQDEGVGPKGAVDFEADGKAVINFFEGADVSTAVHEVAHVARRRLFDTTVDQTNRLGIADADIRVAEEWSGATRNKDGTAKWSVAAEEKFARGFEKYLKTGKAPNDALKDIFSKFAGWLKGIYDHVAGNAVDDIKISPEMKEVFDKLVSRGDIDTVRVPMEVPAPRAAAAVEAPSAIKDYQTRLETEHGADWQANAKPGQLRHLKKLESAENRTLFQSGEPGYRKGASPPPEGTSRGLNLDKMAHGAEVRAALDALPEDLRNAAYEHIDRGGPLPTITDADVVEQGQFWASVLGRDEDATQAMLRQHLQEGSAWIAAQQALRNWADTLVGDVVETQTRLKNVGDTHEDLVHLLMQSIQAKQFIEASRSGGSLAGMGLQRHNSMAGWDVRPGAKPRPEPTSTGTGTGTGTGGTPHSKVMPESMYRGDSPDAIRVREEIIKTHGGGSLEKGIKNIKKLASEVSSIKDNHGTGAALKHLDERARMPQMLVEYWINSILSGPLTHAVNMTSNTLNTLFMPFEQFMGDLLTLKWDKAFGEDLQMYAHLASSLQDATKAAGAAWKNWGDSLDVMGKIDVDNVGRGRALSAKNMPRVANTIGESATDWIGKQLNLPSRLLMAEDAFFKHLNYRATVKGGLTKEGIKAGMRGAALDAHVKTNFDKMIKDGQFYTYTGMRTKAEAEARAAHSKVEDLEERTKLIQSHILNYMEKNWNDDHGVLAKQALDYGREITYTQSLDDPGRNAAVRAAGGFNRWVNDYPILRLVSPFVRTPTNLLAFYVKRSVVGSGWDAFKHIEGGIKTREMRRVSKEMAEEFADKSSDIVGRVATGSMLTFGAIMGVQSGNLTGGGPKDPEKRRMMEAQGWQPYSIRVGDAWWSYKRFDPFANFLGVIADIAEATNEVDGDEMSMIDTITSHAIFAASRNVMSKSYLTGLARVANVLSQPERYGESYMEATVSSFLPMSGLASQTFGNAEHQLEIRGVLDAMRAKYGLTSEDSKLLGVIPVGDTRIESKRNVFGEKLDRPQPLYNTLPIHRSEIKDDKVLKELSNINASFGPPKKIRNGINTVLFTNRSGQTFYDRWQENHGKVRLRGRTLKQAVRDLMRSAAYNRLSEQPFEGDESPRVGEIRKLIRKYRNAAYSTTLREFPEVDRQDRRNTQIDIYRKSGRDIQGLLEY